MKKVSGDAVVAAYQVKICEPLQLLKICENTGKYHGKIPSFHRVCWCENLWKCKVSGCGNCAFPKNFHTRKIVEILVLYAVYESEKNRILTYFIQRSVCVTCK